MYVGCLQGAEGNSSHWRFYQHRVPSGKATCRQYTRFEASCPVSMSLFQSTYLLRVLPLRVIITVPIS